MESRNSQLRRRATIKRAGFTLTELLVVIGLIVLLISLLLPALGKARAAANSAACLSNLRQMGNAWMNYMTNNRGRLPENVGTTAVPGSNWQWTAYWTGILDQFGVRGNAILCPSANEAIPFLQPLKGFGNVTYAWSGKYNTIGGALRLSANVYREGSYGYNSYLTAGNGFGVDGRANYFTSVKQPVDVPVFLDAVAPDFTPLSGAATPETPPNLRFEGIPSSAPEHWRFLIARHGRGVNVLKADGSAGRVPLEETYMLTWKSQWTKYKLSLPAY